MYIHIDLYVLISRYHIIFHFMQRNIQQVCNASLISIWLCIFKFSLQHLIFLEPRNDEFIKMARPCPFIQILSRFYPDFILILSRFGTFNFIQILSRFFPNFIQILSKFCFNFISISLCFLKIPIKWCRVSSPIFFDRIFVSLLLSQKRWKNSSV